VADLWPEFGAYGTEAVTLRHLPLHTASVPGRPADTTVDDRGRRSRQTIAADDHGDWD
jgi:hypothetical protein